MGAIIYIPPSEVTGEQIFTLYKLFCTAYSVKCNKDDERWMKEQAVEYLRSGGIDYRPYFGGKFFVNKTGQCIRSHGYSDPDDSQWKKKDQTFVALIKREFNKLKIKVE